MKKLFPVLLVCLLILAACSGDPAPGPGGSNPEGGLEGSLEDILAEIYATGNFTDNFADYTIPGLISSEINADNCEYHLGKSGLEFEEAIASEHEMSGSAYALCLVRTKEGADIDKLKEDIRDNVDPFKWVCVGVDPDNIIVDNIGDIIILIMSDTDAEALHNAFLALAE